MAGAGGWASPAMMARTSKRVPGISARRVIRINRIVVAKSEEIGSLGVVVVADQLRATDSHRIRSASTRQIIPARPCHARQRIQKPQRGKKIRQEERRIREQEVEDDTDSGGGDSGSDTDAGEVAKGIQGAGRR